MAGGGVGIAVAAAVAVAASALGGCGDHGGAPTPDRENLPDREGLLFRVPTEQMEPTLGFRSASKTHPVSFIKYVLGDRRADNSDSRDWGPIRTEWVIGRVVGRATPGLAERSRRGPR